MRKQRVQLAKTKPVKPKSDQGHVLTTKSLGLHIEQSGGLSQEQIATIKQWTWAYLAQAGDELYSRTGIPKDDYVFFELTVIDLLLHPATYHEKWPGFKAKQQRVEMINLIQKAADLDRLLDKCSMHLAGLYEKSPETVESYLLHWQNLLHRLRDQAEMFGHNLATSPFFPLIEKWLKKENALYPQEKILHRLTILDRIKMAVQEENRDLPAAQSDQDRVEEGEALMRAGNDHPNETHERADPTLAETIEEQLEPLKSLLSQGDFHLLVQAKMQYFEKGHFPTLKKKILFKRVNKRKVGWILTQLYRLMRPTMVLDAEYLDFGHRHLSVFEGSEFNKNNHTKSNLYVYYTTKTN